MGQPGGSLDHGSWFRSRIAVDDCEDGLNKDDCDGCTHYYNCSRPCLYLDIIRRLSGVKNIPRRERLAPPDPDDMPIRENSQDYKQLLSDLQRARQRGRRINITMIRQLNNDRAKLIICALYGGIPLSDIAGELGISESWAYRLIKGG